MIWSNDDIKSDMTFIYSLINSEMSFSPSVVIVMIEIELPLVNVVHFEIFTLNES